MATSRRKGVLGALDWYFAWALPGMGMFSEAYIIFSAGQIKPFQQTIYPTCWKTYVDCDPEMIKHLSGYIQICGIMAGMLLWGFLADITGRKWGSRIVAAIMLSGCILLTFSPYATSPYGYFVYFMVAQTWYGFGVGGEYPLASASAAERSACSPELRAYRGRQVILVFSNQGMGNITNAAVILICMAIFGQTGAVLTPGGSRNVLILSYGFGAVACVVMVVYRFMFLEESEMFVEVDKIEHNLAAVEHVSNTKLMLRKQMVSLYYFGWRQMVASVAWVCNDFAFYGNKLQQNIFLNLLYPGSTAYIKQQWNVLNSFISLLGYYCAAWLVDKPWYGRVKMQYIGFLAMFVFYIVIYGQWENMGAQGSTQSGLHAFQALYYLSSFFNQFGPNATTWLVAGEIFPTDIRAGYHGFAACMGKLGAIIATLWISYIDVSSTGTGKVFLVSALWGICGAIVTIIWLPDTTGLELEEYDRLQRYILAGKFSDYHGEALNRKHLSLWEIYVSKWHHQYDKELDRKAFEEEVLRLSVMPAAKAEMGRMHVISHETFEKISNSRV